MPNLIVTAKELATSAVTFQKAKYDAVSGKAREARVMCVFPVANTPYAFPHALKAVPTSFSVVSSGRNGGAPGTIYCDDLPLGVSKQNIVLKCSTANTWADIVVR